MSAGSNGFRRSAPDSGGNGASRCGIWSRGVTPCRGESGPRERGGASPDRRVLAAATEDGVVCFLDITDGSEKLQKSMPAARTPWPFRRREDLATGVGNGMSRCGTSPSETDQPSRCVPR